MITYIVIGLVIVIICITVYFIGRKLLYDMIDRRIERFQSETIEKQVVEMQNMYRQIRGWRHDYRNHINNMKIQLSEGNLKKLDEYLTELAGDLETVDTVVKTGNVMADAILNSKLSIAGKQGIRINAKANIPDNIPMTDVELCSVLGNMLDNAIEACVKLPKEERFLRVYINTIKRQLYFSVQNSAGAVIKKKGTYFSTKEGEHGYGLFRIDRIAKKYGGYINRQYDEGIFATELMIPLAIHSII